MRTSGQKHDVFVYGTLLYGEPNHYILGDAVRGEPVKTAPGYKLYDIGYYPGMVVEGDEQVTGELYRVDDETLARIDALEEVPDYYQRVTVLLEDGRAVYGYTLPERFVDGARSVRGGDWRAWSQRRKR